MIVKIFCQEKSRPLCSQRKSVLTTSKSECPHGRRNDSIGPEAVTALLFFSCGDGGKVRQPFVLLAVINNNDFPIVFILSFVRSVPIVFTGHIGF